MLCSLVNLLLVGSRVQKLKRFRQHKDFVFLRVDFLDKTFKVVLKLKLAILLVEFLIL